METPVPVTFSQRLLRPVSTVRFCCEYSMAGIYSPRDTTIYPPDDVSSMTCPPKRFWLAVDCVASEVSRPRPLYLLGLFPVVIELRYSGSTVHMSSLRRPASAPRISAPGSQAISKQNIQRPSSAKVILRPHAITSQEPAEMPRASSSSVAIRHATATTRRSLSELLWSPRLSPPLHRDVPVNGIVRVASYAERAAPPPEKKHDFFVPEASLPPSLASSTATLQLRRPASSPAARMGRSASSFSSTSTIVPPTVRPGPAASPIVPAAARPAPSRPMRSSSSATTVGAVSRQRSVSDATQGLDIHVKPSNHLRALFRIQRLASSCAHSRALPADSAASSTFPLTAVVTKEQTKRSLTIASEVTQAQKLAREEVAKRRAAIEERHREKHAARQRLIDIEAEHMREESHYVELEFEQKSVGTYHEKEGLAAKKFDIRHVERSSASERQLARLKYDPESLAGQKTLRVGCNLVRRNKYVVPETYNPFAPPPGYHRKHSKRGKTKPWRLDDSIWRPRKDHGNSKDFFETPEALRRMFNADWRMTRLHHQLVQFIVKVANKMSDWKEAIPKAIDAPEVMAVEAVIWRHARTLYGAFDYYSLLTHISKTRTAGANDHSLTLIDDVGRNIKTAQDALDRLKDVHCIGEAAFFTFARDCDLIGVHCSSADVENIWRLINAPDGGTAEYDHLNRKQFFNRHEWLQACVRIAVRLYCRVDPLYGFANGSTADALDKLCYENLLGKLPREAVHNSNQFRKSHCYNENVDHILKQHGGTLHVIFNCYSGLAESGVGKVDAERSMLDANLMSAGEWVNLLIDLELIEMELVSVQMGLQVYQWSRIRTAHDYSNHSEIRLRNLQFEDFLECLVRLATMLAMPTPEEIDESGTSNAAEFLHGLRDDVPDAYHEYVQRRRLGMLETPHQPTHVLITSFLEVIVASISAGLAQHRVDRHNKGHSEDEHHQLRHSPELARAHSSSHVTRAAGVHHAAKAPSHGAPMHGTTAHGAASGSRGAPHGIPGMNMKSRFSESELHTFRDHRVQGGGLLTGTARLNGVTGSEIVAAMQRSEEHVMDALRHVPAFEELTDDELLKLRAAMSLAKYNDGETVFNQGDEGDSFYLITTGHCEVRRVDPKDLRVGVEEEDKLMCRLHPSDCFGERALMFDEPRAASIYAGPGCNLYTVFITRDDFEATLGKPLSEFQKLKHVAAPGEEAHPEHQ